MTSDRLNEIANRMEVHCVEAQLDVWKLERWYQSGLWRLVSKRGRHHRGNKTFYPCGDCQLQAAELRKLAGDL